MHGPRTAYFCDCCNEAQPYHRDDCPGGTFEAVRVVPATALVRLMAHSDPLPGPGTDEAWDAALALLSEEDKRQVFGS